MRLVIFRFPISDRGKLVSNWKVPVLGLGKRKNERLLLLVILLEEAKYGKVDDEDSVLPFVSNMFFTGKVVGPTTCRIHLFST